MNFNDSMPFHQSNPYQSHQSRRNQSAFTQKCINHLHPRQQLHPQPIHDLKNIVPKYNHSDYQARNKENYLESIRQSIPEGDLRLENMALKNELQKQKEKYEMEINRLVKNIQKKDELLDQCEVEITNLKVTYKKIFAQKAINTAKNNVLLNQHSQFDRRSQQASQRHKKEGISRVEPALIPLSLMPKQLSGQPRCIQKKLSHGLIKRVI